MIQFSALHALLKRAAAPAAPSAIALTRKLAYASGDAAGPSVADTLAIALNGLDDSALVDYLSAVASELADKWRFVIHQLNLAKGGTALLVDLRRRLLALARAQPELLSLEKELQQTLTSWFNGGFLMLRRIDWDSPASLVERLMKYEAVHPIASWNAMQRRLASDRCCFGFFHPAMPDDPLIFVQVALTREISATIAPIFEASVDIDPAPTTAIFYSISNCQRGLNGIPFGNLLIKRVVTELRRELPSLTTFATLSPIPGFRRWLERATDDQTGLSDVDRGLLAKPDWWNLLADREALETPLTRAVARYLMLAPDGRGLDPVAHFHLSNGARVERINWLANMSNSGLAQSYGMMVNYLYRLDHIEQAQDSYRSGRVPCARPVETLLKPPRKGPFRKTGHHQRGSLVHG